MSETPVTGKLLIVEDDATTALLYKTMARKERFEVEHCADGQTALNLLSKNDYDGVILDLMMPRVDGMQVLKQMRASPKHAFTPVIVSTAAVLDLVEKEALRYGVKHFLEKTQTNRLLAGLREINSTKGVVSGPRLRMASLDEEPDPTPPPPPVADAPKEDAEEPAAKSLLGRLFGRKPG